jgi:hypothetical protein
MHESFRGVLVRHLLRVAVAERHSGSGESVLEHRDKFRCAVSEVDDVEGLSCGWPLIPIVCLPDGCAVALKSPMTIMCVRSVQASRSRLSATCCT